MEEIKSQIANLPITDPHDATVLDVIGVEYLDKIMALIHQAETKAYQKGFNYGIDQYQDNLINIVRGK